MTAEEMLQIQVIDWAYYNTWKYPQLELMFHVANEGKRNVVQGVKLKRMGLKKGVPDLVLPCGNGKYTGLYIELKTAKGRPTAEQKKWIKNLTDAGNYAKVCYGFEDAVQTIKHYLEGEI